MANDAAIRFEFEQTLLKNGFDLTAARLAATAMQTGSSELMDRALKRYVANRAASDFEKEIHAEQAKAHKEATEAAEIDNIANEVEAVMGIKVSDRERYETLKRVREQQEAFRAAEDPAEIERQMNEVLDPFNEYQLDKPLDW